MEGKYNELCNELPFFSGHNRFPFVNIFTEYPHLRMFISQIEERKSSVRENFDRRVEMSC